MVLCAIQNIHVHDMAYHSGDNVRAVSYVTPKHILCKMMYNTGYVAQHY